MSLLATAIYYEALRGSRKALADRIQADFLRSIDYDSDETAARVFLSDESDNNTFQYILNTGETPPINPDEDTVSRRLVQSYRYLSRQLRDDLRNDPFKRLGKWTDFLTNKVYFAVFVHPDASSAYQVYEVINTRGKELTTADLLKNFVLSQTPPTQRHERYKRWQSIAARFSTDGTNTFVQYIRHAITVSCGHVLPKDLFEFLAERVPQTGKRPPSPDELMQILERYLPIYQQMIDPTLDGPAEPEALRIFAALNSLGVIAVRPILLAIADVPDAMEGMKYVLRLVVRRIVVGNLGTGNVERKFGEAARKVHDGQDWHAVHDELEDLNPSKEEFVEQIRRRSFNKAVLAFARRSIIQNTITPNSAGVLHYVWTRNTPDWREMPEEDGSYWASTIGNTLLSKLDRRPKEVVNWDTFKAAMLPHAVEGEWTDILSELNKWDASAVDDTGKKLAEAAAHVWYG